MSFGLQRSGPCERTVIGPALSTTGCTHEIARGEDAQEVTFSVVDGKVEQQVEVTLEEIGLKEIEKEYGTQASDADTAAEGNKASGED